MIMKIFVSILSLSLVATATEKTLQTQGKPAKSQIQVFSKDSESDSFQDQVRVIRPFDEGWEVTFEKRQGIYQTRKEEHQEVLKEAKDSNSTVNVEVDSNSDTLLSVKLQKPKKLSD